jgi:hypothetical protein
MSGRGFETSAFGDVVEESDDDLMGAVRLGRRSSASFRSLGRRWVTGPSTKQNGGRGVICFPLFRPADERRSFSLLNVQIFLGAVCAVLC